MSELWQQDPEFVPEVGYTPWQVSHLKAQHQREIEAYQEALDDYRSRYREAERRGEWLLVGILLAVIVTIVAVFF